MVIPINIQTGKAFPLTRATPEGAHQKPSAKHPKRISGRSQSHPGPTGVQGGRQVEAAEVWKKKKYTSNLHPDSLITNIR